MPTSRFILLALGLAACKASLPPAPPAPAPAPEAASTTAPSAPAAGDYCAVLARMLASTADGFKSLRGEQIYNDPDDEDDDAEFPTTLALPGTEGCQIEAQPDDHALLECRAFASNGTAAGVDAGAAAYSAEGEKLARCLSKDRFDMKDTGPNEVTFVSHSYYGPSVRIRGKMSENDGKPVVQIFVAVIAADKMPEKPTDD